MRALFQNRLLLGVLLMVAMMARVLVPVGWMPSTASGQWVMLCSGTGQTAAWIDAQGKLHKDGAPASKPAAPDCAFAGLGVGFDLPHSVAPLLGLIVPTALPLLRPWAVQIGQGLAAPPPPKTGPPHLI